MNPLPTLAGERCLLRELVLADAASLQRHADDEAVWRNMFDGFPRPYTLADAEAWCDGGWRGWRDAGLVWGIERDGEVIGCIGVTPAAGWLRCNAEIGWWIGRAHWRRGITGEALRLLSAWVWQALPEVTRLHASIFDWNEPSMAVARHAGFVLEGRMPQSAIKAGRLIGRVQYGLYRP